MTTLDQVINKYNIRLTSKYLGLDEHKSKNNHNCWQFNWECTLHVDNRMYTFPFSQGIAHCKILSGYSTRHSNPKERMTLALVRALKPYGSVTVSDLEGFVEPTEPNLIDVLDCLRSDASAALESRDYEDFCATFGYDTDSKKATEIYSACQTVHLKLYQLLGGEAHQELLMCEYE